MTATTRAAADPTSRLPPSEPFGSTGLGSVVVLAVVWLLSAAYIWRFVPRGWIPYDEGCLAQSAERVLSGQVPHRDFDEIYTGGLSYLHGAAMQVFGRDLLSIRLVLFGAFLVFVPVLFLLSRRFAPPWLAGAVTLTAVVWSFPNYFAGLPSWYNLIFTALGTLCVVKHVETGRRRFLILAGICGGLSFLVKVVGLYFLFGVGFFLLYREEQRIPADGIPGRRPSLLLMLKGALALGTPLTLLVLLRDRLLPMEIVHFVVPASAIALLVFWQEMHRPKPVGVPRWRPLAALLVPLGIGAALPVALFLLLYLRGGAIPDFVRGVFLLPQRRLSSASMNLPSLSSLLPALPLAILWAAIPLGLGRRTGRVLAALLVAALCALVPVSGQWDAYPVIWLSARSLGVVAVLVGCMRLARLPEAPEERLARQKVFLLVAVSACVGLQQFPFAGAIYFCYVAPIVILALLAVDRVGPARGRELRAAVLGFYFFFALLWLNPGYVWKLGQRFQPYVADALLDVPRGGLRIPREDRDLYRDLLGLVRGRSRGRTIYAGPDTPEIYFLAGLPNPTRAILEFNSVSPTRGLPLPTLLEDNGSQVVVINRAPAFSAPLEPSLVRELESGFPESRPLGPFVVRWRER